MHLVLYCFSCVHIFLFVIFQYSKQSVTSIVFQDSYTVISSGACDGALKFWDLRRNYTNHKANPVAFHVIQYPGRGNRKYGMMYILSRKCEDLHRTKTFFSVNLTNLLLVGIGRNWGKQ